MSDHETLGVESTQLPCKADIVRDALGVREWAASITPSSYGVMVEREMPAAFAALDALVAERSALTKERDAALAATGGPLYNEWSQRWVDQVCHYRNLAIALGAKPEDMLDGYDRKLCEHGIQDDDDYTQKNEARETWKDLETAEAERDELAVLVTAWMIDSSPRGAERLMEYMVARHSAEHELKNDVSSEGGAHAH